MHRRRVLFGAIGAGAVLAMRGAPAAGAKMRSVAEFGADGRTTVDVTAAFQKAAGSGASVLVIPQGYYRLEGDVHFRDVDLRIDGRITGPGTLHFAGDTRLSGSGAISSGGAHGPSGFILDGEGTFLVHGLTFEHCRRYAALLIAPPAGTRIRSVEIRGCTVRDSNYGVARAGRVGGAVERAVVRDNVFRDLQGDAIEFDLAMRDGPIRIENNDIATIDNTHRRRFWGLGIGISGDRYTADHDPAHSAKHFVIRNNRIRNVRQGIHVEAARDFIIEGNRLDDINERVSPDAGVEPCGIVVIGSNRFAIRRNMIRNSTVARAIWVKPGNDRSDSTDYTVSHNKVAGHGLIYSQLKFGPGRMTIRDNVAAGFRFGGSAQGLKFWNNVATDPAVGIELSHQ